jgi:hypothetical protein
VSLSSYSGLPDSSKIHAAAHQQVSIHGLYFSADYCPIGLYVDCFGPCFPLTAQRRLSHFSGRLILVSSTGRDTIHLKCERERWETSVAHPSASVQRVRPNRLQTSGSYTIRGQLIGSQPQPGRSRSIIVRDRSRPALR